MASNVALALVAADLTRAGTALCEAGAVAGLMEQLTRLHACASWRDKKAVETGVSLLDCFTKAEATTAAAVSKLLLALVRSSSQAWIALRAYRSSVCIASTST